MLVQISAQSLPFFVPPRSVDPAIAMATAQNLGAADPTCPLITDAAAFKAHKSPMVKSKLAAFRDQLMALPAEEQA